MLRGISSTGLFGHAKQCVINAFDTNCMLSADEVMAIILHLPHDMDEEDAPGALTPDTSPPPSLRLSLPVAARTSVEDTTPVALVVVVASPTSAAPVAAWTTFCPLALPRMTPS
jgi:hypothetical protein